MNKKDGFYIDQEHQSMLRKHRVLIIITSLITLLPILVGILCWNRLPDTIATHFASDGTPNGFSSKTFTVLGIPAFIFAAHILCAFCTAIDPKHKNISPKMYRLILLICPICSIVCGAAIYGYALSLSMADWLNSTFFMNLLMGITCLSATRIIRWALSFHGLWQTRATGLSPTDLQEGCMPLQAFCVLSMHFSG